MKTPHYCFLFKLCFAAHFMVLSSFSQAEDIVIGGYDYPPFMDAKSNQGIYHDFMTAISHKTKLNFKWQYYPYARLNKLFELGKVQIEVGSTKEWTSTSNEPGLFTDSFYSLQDIALFKQGKAFAIKAPKDIEGKTIGMVRGYVYQDFESIFKSKKAIRIDAKDEQRLLHMLYHGRLDAIFINKDVFLSATAKQPMFKQLLVGDVVGSYNVGIRVHPSLKHIIPSLNQAIKNLKHSESLQTEAETRSDKGNL